MVGFILFFFFSLSLSSVDGSRGKIPADKGVPAAIIHAVVYRRTELGTEWKMETDGIGNITQRQIGHLFDHYQTDGTKKKKKTGKRKKTEGSFGYFIKELETRRHVAGANQNEIHRDKCRKDRNIARDSPIPTSCWCAFAILDRGQTVSLPVYRTNLEERSSLFKCSETEGFFRRPDGAHVNVSNKQ